MLADKFCHHRFLFWKKRKEDISTDCKNCCEEEKIVFSGASSVVRERTNIELNTCFWWSVSKAD